MQGSSGQTCHPRTAPSPGVRPILVVSSDAPHGRTAVVQHNVHVCIRDRLVSQMPVKDFVAEAHTQFWKSPPAFADVNDLETAPVGLRLH